MCACVCVCVCVAIPRLCGAAKSLISSARLCVYVCVCVCVRVFRYPSSLRLETCGSMICPSVRFRFDSMSFPAVPVPVPVLILVLNYSTISHTKL